MTHDTSWTQQVLRSNNLVVKPVTQRQDSGAANRGGKRPPTVTLVNFMATSLNPLASKRLMTSPTMPRCTPSGFTMIKLISECDMLPTDGERPLKWRKALRPGEGRVAC